MLENTNLDVFSYTTIQTLAGDYKTIIGCYDDVFMFSGFIQHDISHCFIGGRCMFESNKMYHVKGKIADVDACSLYPRAMRRMLGCLKGKPSISNDTSYNFINKS